MSISHWGVFPGLFYERQYGQEYGWAVCSYWRELSFDFWAALGSGAADGRRRTQLGRT